MGAIAIAAETPAQRAALAAVIGAAVPVDADGFDAVLEPWCRARRLHPTVELLVSHGIPAAPVVGSRNGDDNPQHRARGFYEAVTHPLVGTHRIGAFPAVFGRQPRQRFARPAPMLGEHNREVLGGLLGLDDSTLDALVAAAIIGERPVGS
jgi:crotonobetainyl-CoA:carnitine CoA-transferase CaiB-like acyl-CoA transferase